MTKEQENETMPNECENGGKKRENNNKIHEEAKEKKNQGNQTLTEKSDK